MPSFVPRFLFVIFLPPFSLLLAQEKQALQPIKAIQGPDWVLETKSAAWQARDSQGEFVHQNKLWILGGWFNSKEAPPRDLSSSEDGRTWNLVKKEIPILHTDLPMSISFKNQMWMMGGWHNGRLPGHSASNQVWASSDGTDWKQITSKAQWSLNEADTSGAIVILDQE